MQDRDFALDVLKCDGLALAYASESFKEDKEMVITACLTFPGAIENAAESLKKDENFIITVAKNLDFRKYSTYGDTTEGKINNFLHDAGFSSSDIDRLSRIIKTGKAVK